MKTKQADKRRVHKLPVAKWVVAAIQELRPAENQKRRDKELPESAGIHVVWSGFNRRFKEEYGKDADPKAVTDKLADDGIIVKVPWRGGAMVFIKGEEPDSFKHQLSPREDRQVAERIRARVRGDRVG